jgi:WD40 repeat protein
METGEQPPVVGLGRTFISYARRDDEPFVRELTSDLRARGLRVWRDRDSMPSRGRTFRQEIRDSIAVDDRLVLIVGPRAIESRQVSAEWRQALENCSVVVPVLRLGDRSLIPDELAKFHQVDARTPRPYEETLVELLRILTDAVPALGDLRGVEKLPEHYVARPNDLRQLEKSVLADVMGPVVITSSRQTTALQGMGGLGKSVLAAAFASSCSTRRVFGDGIVWVRFGQEPDMASRIRLVGQALGDQDLTPYVDLSAGKLRLMTLLADRACLLVLDDLWDVQHAETLRDALGSRCRLIVTTRDGSIATALGAQEFRLDVLSPTQARSLLGQWAELDQAALPAEALSVLDECGNLPFAIALCGAMARDKISWSDLLGALRDADLSFLEASLPNYPYRDVLRSMQVGVDAFARNDPIGAQRYLELAVFPPGMTVPEAAVLTLWQRDRGLDDRGARKLLATAERKALLRLEGNGSQRRLLLHDLQYDYLRAVQPNLAHLHSELLAAYRRGCPNGWPTGPNDGYFFQQLPYHLVHAGKIDELRTLVFNFDWLSAKLSATDAAALADDLDRLPGDAEARLLVNALRLSAHVLAQDPGQLAGQLWGRLPSDNHPAIEALLAGAKRNNQSALLPTTASLAAADGRMVRTLVGHREVVTAVALTPDGRRAISASETSLIVWDLATGRLERTLAGQSGWFRRLALTSDGRLLSGASDGAPRLWRVSTGEVLQTLIGHRDSAQHVSITPDGAYAATGSDDKTVRFWNITRGTCEWVLPHVGTISAIALTPDAKRIVSGTHDSELIIWETETGKPVNPPDQSWRTGREVIARDGSRAMQYAGDGRRIVIDPITNADLASPPGHTHPIWALALTPDGRQVVSASLDHTLRIWDLHSGAELAVLRGHTGAVTAVVVTPDGRYALSGSHDKTVRVWDLKDGQLLSSLEGHAFDVNAIAVTPDGLRAVSASEDRTLRVWDLDKRSQAFTLVGHTDLVSKVAVSTDGQYAVSTSRDSTVRVWDIGGTARPDQQRSHVGRVNAIAVTPDGQRAVTAAGAQGPLSAPDHTLKVWDVKSGAELSTLKGHTNDVWTVAVAPDGKRAISGADDHDLRLWDLDEGVCLAVLSGHEGKIWAVQVAADGTLAVSAGSDGDLRVWDLVKQRLLWTLKGHEGSVTNVRILPNGRHAVSCCEDRSIKIWDIQEGLLVRTLRPGRSQTYALAITPDGRRLVSGAEDGTVTIWDLASGVELAEFADHTGAVVDLVVTPDGGRAISASALNDHTVREWDLNSLCLVHTLRGHSSYVRQVATLAGGRHVVSASLDATVRIWDVQRGIEVAKFVADSQVLSCAVAGDGPRIVAGEQSGRVHFLRFEGQA